VDPLAYYVPYHINPKYWGAVVGKNSPLIYLCLILNWKPSPAFNSK